MSRQLKIKKLSILIPVFNEFKTILKLIDKVQKVNLSRFGISKELVIVDDYSTDGTRDVLKKIQNKYSNVKLFYHKKNMGKGAAVRTAIKSAKGQIMIVQDADMEYDPQDYVQCIKPIIDGKALVVYGSRRLKTSNKQHSSFSFFLGGMLITLAFDILYLQRLTDEPTCYKTFRSDIIKKINIKGNRFEWEPEVTAKIAKKGIKIIEVPISYYPRHVNEGKKIKWEDGFIAIWTLIKYRFVND